MKKTLLLVFLLPLFISCTSSVNINKQQKRVQTDLLPTGLESIHTLDVYSDNSIIHALVSGKATDSKKNVVHYLQSQDFGASWSQAINVITVNKSVKKSKRGDDFQIAAYQNRIIAAWKTVGAEPWVGNIAMSYSDDYGKSWKALPSPINSNLSAIDQGYFDLSADKQGQFHFSWLDDREEKGDTQGLRYARLTENNGLYQWIDQQTLEADACTCCWTKMVSDQNGETHLLFRDDNPRDMKMISTQMFGEKWPEQSETVWPFNWEFIGCPHQGGALTSSQSEHQTFLHSLVWNGDAKNRGLFYIQSSANKTTPPQLTPIGDNTCSSGDIAATEHKLATVYTCSTIDAKILIAQFSSDNGVSWPNKIILNRKDSAPSHPRVIATKTGFRFFWTEWLDNGQIISKTAIIN